MEIMPTDEICRRGRRFFAAGSGCGFGRHDGGVYCRIMQCKGWLKKAEAAGLVLPVHAMKKIPQTLQKQW